MPRLRATWLIAQAQRGSRLARLCRTHIATPPLLLTPDLVLWHGDQPTPATSAEAATTAAAAWPNSTFCALHTTGVREGLHKRTIACCFSRAALDVYLLRWRNTAVKPFHTWQSE